MVDEISSSGQSDRAAPRQPKARTASNSDSISDAFSRDTGQTAARCAKIRQRRPISGCAPRVLNSRCTRHGQFPPVLSTVHAQSALAAVWEHCPCSMRSGCGLAHCLPRTLYFAGFTHCRPQMAPNPRLSDLFRQTLGSSFRGGKNSPNHQSARTHLSSRPSQGSGRRRAPQPLIPYVVRVQGTERSDAVAGARRTPGRHKTGGVCHC